MTTRTNDNPAPTTPTRHSGAGPAGRPSGAPGSRPYTPGGRRRPPIRRRLCRVCQERKGHIDWKAVNFLRSFITERGKILSARSTGTCSKCQRALTNAIKRARNLALLPTSPV